MLLKPEQKEKSKMKVKPISNYQAFFLLQAPSSEMKTAQPRSIRFCFLNHFKIFGWKSNTPSGAILELWHIKENWFPTQLKEKALDCSLFES